MKTVRYEPLVTTEQAIDKVIDFPMKVIRSLTDRVEAFHDFIVVAKRLGLVQLSDKAGCKNACSDNKRGLLRAG